jgi:site-specific DNA recombinase
LCSEAALGYLMHGGRPVLGADGRPVRLAEPLWDRATHDALVTATAPKRDGTRAPKGMRLLTGAAFCGNCGARLQVTGRGHARYAYECTARIRGIRAYDPGTGHAAQIAELEATRSRLREDRQAGLYDSAEDAEWYRAEYRRLGRKSRR